MLVVGGAVCEDESSSKLAGEASVHSWQDKYRLNPGRYLSHHSCPEARSPFLGNPPCGPLPGSSQFRAAAASSVPAQSLGQQGSFG